jgi:hypothetical protein
MGQVTGERDGNGGNWASNGEGNTGRRDDFERCLAAVPNVPPPDGIASTDSREANLALMRVAADTAQPAGMQVQKRITAGSGGQQTRSLHF